jgi:hypothetical protein
MLFYDNDTMMQDNDVTSGRVSWATKSIPLQQILLKGKNALNNLLRQLGISQSLPKRATNVSRVYEMQVQC